MMRFGAWVLLSCALSSCATMQAVTEDDEDAPDTEQEIGADGDRDRAPRRFVSRPRPEHRSVSPRTAPASRNAADRAGALAIPSLA